MKEFEGMRGDSRSEFGIDAIVSSIVDGFSKGAEELRRGIGNRAQKLFSKSDACPMRGYAPV
jgi:hypothetical protein